VYDVSRPLKISILPSGCRRYGENYAVEAATMRHYPIPLRATLTITLMLMAGAAVAGQREDGVAAVNSRDYATALRLFRPLANQGDDVAQFDLGLLYNKGWGVPRDYVQAVMWYRRAADQGNADAQYNLGLLYDKAHRYAEAMHWYRKAADQALADAQYNRGILYAKGHGVPQDCAEALAADQDVADAQGQGVPQDFVQAYKWLDLSVAQDNNDAKKK
jgi:uncharacterized protein